MPLPNDAETQWTGYLIDGLGGQTQVFLQAALNQVTSASLPSVRATLTAVNMWWRDKSPCLDLKSSVDGDVACTVHAMDYGSAMFIGIAFAPTSKLGNYYKRMAAAAFLESVDRCVNRTIQSLSGTAPQVVELAALGKGKFGG